MKKILLLIMVLFFCVSMCACSTLTSYDQEMQYDKDGTEHYEVDDENEETSSQEKYIPISEGTTVTSENWKITLTDAYTSKTLKSNQSRTAWDANEGYAFLILEFDITCLNSSHPTVRGDAITELIANAGGNTYESWEFQYLNSEIWCYIRNNNTLDANLPLHIYVYTMIPSSSMYNDVSVNLKIAGQPKEITIY